MYRPLPISSKLLNKKWEENNKRIHQEKLKNMQPRVKSNKPAEFFHLKVKSKRDQMLEDRFTEIERENRILLEKMSSIMNKKQNKDGLGEVKSLNTNARKLEMRRITQANQALLRRLQEKSPCYNSQQWEEDRKKTERRLKNICEFPYLTNRDKSTPVSMKKTRKISPISKQSVFKKGIAIADKHFVVEVRKNKRHVLVYLNDVESPDSYSLQIPVREAVEIMGGKFDFDVLLNMLEMENGEIVLVDVRENTGKFRESAPPGRKNAGARDGMAGSAGFENKPKSHNLVGVNRSFDIQQSEKMGKTEYDGFRINARVKDEQDVQGREDKERGLKECCLKLDGKGFVDGNKLRDEEEGDDDNEEEEEEEEEEENEEYYDEDPEDDENDEDIEKINKVSEKATENHFENDEEFYESNEASKEEIQTPKEIVSSASIPAESDPPANPSPPSIDIL